jgi:hypothetical protein
VPAMKVTVNAAMRARDVSRPSAEQLAEAEAAEARFVSAPASPRAGVTLVAAATGNTDARDTEKPSADGSGPHAPRPQAPSTQPPDAEAAPAEGPGGPGKARRRRMPRDSRRISG